VDTDLFRWTAVGGLAALAILLLVAIVVIARVGRRIAAAAEAVRDELAEIANRSALAAQAPRAETAREPAVEQRSAADEKRAEPPAQAEVPAADERSGVVEEPARATTTAAAHDEDVTVVDAEATAASASTEDEVVDEPQEQPFERDGRWWFRRGDELLVYDEGTGQWLQAPGSRAGAAGGGARGGSSTATEVAAGAVATRAEDEVGARSAETSSSFWKCPACGAVNGATATSCRMCFTARP
jgi:uncharacterized iron-regulated membrane protein